MTKLGRSCYFYALTGVLGSLLLISLGCDCFSQVPAFVDHRRTFDQSILLSLPCTYRRGRMANAIRSSKNDNDGETKSLLELLSPIASCSVNQMSGTDLAYIGDVVFELFVRSRHVWPSKRTSDLQNTVVGLVRGTSFATLLESETLFINSTQEYKLFCGMN